MTRSATIHIHRHGGAEVLEPATVDVAEPGPGQVRLRQSAIGLNYADIYEREGRHGPHSAKPFPITLGSLGAGVVTALGPGVTHLAVGQSIASLQPGAYQVERLVAASHVVPLPEDIAEDVAAATLLRGLTAEYLLHRLYTVRPGDTVLVHAAAGGMGTLLSQWARALGATVIGTVGSAAKVAVAQQHGCHHVIDYRTEDFAARTLELTGGRGVGVVYDAVGKAVFDRSLDCLRPMGLLISYGTASGDVGMFDLQRLHSKSLSVCRPTLRTFITDPADLRRGAERLFAAARAGDVRLAVDRRYALSDVRQAHEDLEGRRTTGAAVLLP